MSEVNRAAAKGSIISQGGNFSGVAAYVGRTEVAASCTRVVRQVVFAWCQIQAQAATTAIDLGALRDETSNNVTIFTANGNGLQVPAGQTESLVLLGMADKSDLDGAKFGLTVRTVGAAGNSTIVQHCVLALQL